MSIILAEIHYFNILTSSDEVLRVATAPYNHPSAPGPYEDRITDVGVISREIFGDGLNFGSGTSDRGALMLASDRGDSHGDSLDWLQDVAIDGRKVVFSTVESAGSSYASRIIIATMFASSVQVGMTTAEVLMQDSAVTVLDQPMQVDVFAGTNVAGNGVEGGEDLRDVWVPVGEGVARGVQPVLVNAAKRIYVVADQNTVGGLAVIAEALDGGGPITPGTSYSTMAALEAATTTPGRYDWCPGSATERVAIKLGSAPSGDVLIKYTPGNAASRMVGQIFKRVMVERCEVALSDLTASDITDLDVAAPFEVGTWTGRGEVSRRDFLNFITSSVGAAYWVDNVGKWRLVQIVKPSGTAIANFKVLSAPGNTGKVNDFDIIKIEPLFTSRDAGGLPFNSTTCRYAKMHATYSRETIAAVALNRLEELTEEWREASVFNASVKTLHPQSVDKSWDTGIESIVHSSSEAERRMLLFGGGASVGKIKRFTLTIALDADTARLDINNVVTVEFGRYNLTAEQKFCISGIKISFLTKIVTLTIWTLING